MIGTIVFTLPARTRGFIGLPLVDGKNPVVEHIETAPYFRIVARDLAPGNYVVRARSADGFQLPFESEVTLEADKMVWIG